MRCASDGRLLKLLRGVVSHFELLHRPGRIRRPGGVARSMCDSHGPRQPGAELRPAVVALDLDSYRHALNHVSELSRDDIPRHERELCAGRFVDPDHPPSERRREGVELDVNRIARLDAWQAILLQVGLHVQEIRIVHAQQRRARRRVIAQVAVTFHHDSGKRRPDLRVLEVALGGFQRTPRLFDCPLLDLDQQLELADLVVADLGEVDTRWPLSAPTSGLPPTCDVRRRSGSERPPPSPVGPGSGRPGRGPSRGTASPAAGAGACWPLAARVG